MTADSEDPSCGWLAAEDTAAHDPICVVVRCSTLPELVMAVCTLRFKEYTMLVTQIDKDCEQLMHQ